MGPEPIAHRPPLWLVPSVTAIALLAYGATLRDGIGFGDSGELVAAAVELGVPHPPGYPVWTLLSHLWVRALPAADPAWVIALSSALYMALAAGGVAWLLWRAIDLDEAKAPTLARSALAGGGALMFAFSSEAWSAAIATEVYALHMLLAVGIWVCALQWGRGRAPTLMVPCAGFALGLGLANHQTLLLAAPGYAVCLLVCDWRRALRVRTLLLLVVPVLIGVAAYGLLPLWSARDPIVDWSNTETWDGFRAHLTRQQYRSLGVEREAGVVAAQFRFFGGWLVREYVGLLMVGALALLSTWRRETHAGRAWVSGLLVAFLGAGVFFTYIANTELDLSNRRVLSVYFMLPGLFALLLCVPAVAWWLESGSPERDKQAGNVAGAVLALACVQALVVGSRTSRYNNPLGDHFIRHITADLPEDAVVVAGTGAVHFAMLYAKVTGNRPDITGISFNRLASLDYQAEVNNQKPRLTWPTETDYRTAYEQVAPGATAVYGARRIVVASGYVLGKLLQANPDRAFFYDEGIPVPWVYGNAEPMGMLLRLHAKPIPGIRPEVAARDREFWDAITDKLLHLRAYRTDYQAQQAFSRRRSTIGAWYAWHKDWGNAEYALQQAIRLSANNVDAYAKLAMVHAAQGNVAKGEAWLQLAIDRDPENRTLRRLFDAYRAGEARWYGG